MAASATIATMINTITYTIGERITLKANVRDASEGVRALIANYPHVRAELLEQSRLGLRCNVTTNANTLTISPTIGGAGGVDPKVLVFAGVVTLMVASGGAAAPWVGKAGAALLIGGVSQMMMPTIREPNIEEPNERNPSATFNGAVNTTAQGRPVPVGYGQMRVGSAVLSTAIRVNEAAVYD